MNVLKRAIEIPEQLQSIVVASILWLMVQLETWIEAVTGWNFDNVFQEFGSVLAVVLTVLVKIALENLIPERYHSIVNNILVWLAGFLLASALL